MKRGARITACLAVALIIGALPRGVAGQEPQAPIATFRSAVDLVRVTAIVRDHKGRFVQDLTVRDFEVIDNGKTRPITEFRRDQGGVSVALLFDVSGSMKASYFPRGVPVFQNGSVYGQVPLVPEGIYPTMPIDRLPEVVIVQSSRLVAYSNQSAGLRDILAAHYRPLMHVPVERQDAGPPEPVFDQQDAFYAPVAGFHHFMRPGPEIEIFVRSDK